MLDQLLRQLATEAPAVYACAYSYHRDLNLLEPMALLGGELFPAETETAIREIVLHKANQLQHEPVLPYHCLLNTPFKSGLLFRLMWLDEAIGFVALFSETESAYTLADHQRLETWAMLAGTIFENQRLREDQNVALALQYIAGIMGQNPTPQDLLDTLHQVMCGPHIATCNIMFYGPQREDRPNGPFDYLELKGSWSWQMGEGAGLGMRIYMDQYPDFITQVYEQKYLYIPDRREIEGGLDPLIRAFLRQGGIESMLYIALNAGTRRLGVMFFGTDRPYQFSAQEIRNFQAIAEFIGISTMSQLLQQQHNFIQRARAELLDAVTDGVMMVLPNDGTPIAGRSYAYVLTVNQGFTDMFHLSQATAQGLTLSQVIARMQIPQDVGQQLYEAWLSIPIRDSATQQGEFNMVHPDGYMASIEWYSAPVYHEERIMGRMYIFHDATASRTAANLRAHFIARVSHELRTPLTAIKGFSEMILEQMGDELPDLAREYTQIIQNSARHLNELFSDIIEIARADTGEMSLHLTETHLPDLIIDVAAVLEPEYNQRGQKVIMELDDNLLAVHADANRITQVLTNLLSNAVKFGPPESRIRIRTDYLTTRDDLPDSAPPDVVLPCVLVTVADEGPGLSPEDAERVFLPFYRGKEALATKTAGTGLGLTIARRVVELHRGKIWAEGRRRGRKGARFLFTLPTVEA